jgi:hypothetical protein
LVSVGRWEKEVANTLPLQNKNQILNFFYFSDTISSHWKRRLGYGEKGVSWSIPERGVECPSENMTIVSGSQISVSKAFGSVKKALRVREGIIDHLQSAPPPQFTIAFITSLYGRRDMLSQRGMGLWK